ncbi:hypothetical protein N0V93_004299 [Gnomoniopsis smithogilvyi]|uniref:Uncharacterized protein n=1 Tax=Gnomoniopsis smithogilvyi TaxID=1191159 RepID=A0A9W8YQU5_9PEZI|nr:hypothetical protein N0V93_004299 [Gnomoniopsis smithogilvyi]
MDFYCHLNPHFAQTAFDRDLAAQMHLGHHNFNMYDQGSFHVIAARAQAPPPGIAATSTPIDHSRKVNCSICARPVHDFARHNREAHIIDPATAIFCPYPQCTRMITRDGLITIDDHLAASHSDFRNMAGRGGDLLERTDKVHVLKRLTVESAMTVVFYRQSRVGQAEMRRLHLVQALNNANLNYPDIVAATIPPVLQAGAVSVHDLDKSALIDIAVAARSVLNQWERLCTHAEAMLS